MWFSSSRLASRDDIKYKGGSSVSGVAAAAITSAMARRRLEMIIDQAGPTSTSPPTTPTMASKAGCAGGVAPFLTGTDPMKRDSTTHETRSEIPVVLGGQNQCVSQSIIETQDSGFKTKLKLR